MKSLKRFFCMLMAAVLGMGFSACGGSGDGNATNTTRPENYVMTQAETVNSLSATDAYGRSFSPVDAMNPDKKVGIFYFVWMGNHGSASVDNSKTDLSVLQGSTDINVHHYWGEPLYGYYHSEDPWVIYRHIELFIMAGIDYICVDTTNGVYWNASQDYRTAITNLLEALLVFMQQGFDVPKVMFYTNTDSGSNVKFLYDNYYDSVSKPRLARYAPLWFTYGDTNNKNSAGKPWIVANDEYLKLSQEIQDFFYRKESQWPNEYDSSGNIINKENGFPWMCWEPSGRQYNHDGIMSVSIAQHPSGAFSDSVFLGYKDVNRGRGFSLLDFANLDERVNKGSNFQEEWDYAVMQGDKVNNIFITGWNEWVAQKQPSNSSSGGMSYFVDCFNLEFSRDAEMMAGGYGDAFYLQMCDNIRRFKGASAKRVNPFSTAIDINGDEKQWEGTLGFLDITGDTLERNYKSANFSLPAYTDNSGRNDIESVRFTYDNENVYFLIACKRNVKAYESGENWMNILLSVDGTQGESWENYHYVINRAVNGGTSSVERFSSDGTGTVIGSAQIAVNGDKLAVSVPRSAIGLGGKTFKFGFKVADNVTNYTDISDYYVTGDSAPMGRLNYTVKVG